MIRRLLSKLMPNPLGVNKNKLPPTPIERRVTLPHLADEGRSVLCLNTEVLQRVTRLNKRSWRVEIIEYCPTCGWRSARTSPKDPL